MGDGSGHTTPTTSNELVLIWAAEGGAEREEAGECWVGKARGGGAQGGSTAAKRAGDGVQNPTGWCQVDIGCRGRCRAGGRGRGGKSAQWCGAGRVNGGEKGRGR
ncbi:hypothetical protein B0H13DRAFT_1910369, partial [Mycena leptocephala]